MDDAGKLQFRDDIYGLDAKLMSILKGSERQVADVAIERPADPNFKPTPEQGQRLQQRSARRRADPVRAVRTAFPVNFSGICVKFIEKGRISSIRPLTMPADPPGFARAIFRHTPPGTTFETGRGDTVIPH